MTHRPWPLPNRPWAMSMTWSHLLFAHWSVDPALLRPHIPAGLEIDLFEGRAYVGVVPFLMSRVTPRFVPPMPGLHAFPELNLRTYVKTGSKPGVWFFSLDAGQKLAVRVARRFFHLPYFDAEFRVSGDDYVAKRTHRDAAPAELQVSYRPTGEIRPSRPGTLDHWLTERYCLYSANPSGQLYRGEIDHAPWPLQPAEAEFGVNSLGEAFGMTFPGPPETLHFAKELRVRAWLIEPV